MAEYIRNYIKENNIADMSQLINNEDFYTNTKQGFAKKINNPAIFEDDAAFNNFLTQLLRQEFYWKY